MIDSKKEDLFGGTILIFPNSFRGNYPEISSEEMKERITFVHDRKKAFLYEKAETKSFPQVNRALIEQIVQEYLEKQNAGHTPDLQKEEPSISSPPIDLIARALADFSG